MTRLALTGEMGGMKIVDSHSLPAWLTFDPEQEGMGSLHESSSLLSLNNSHWESEFALDEIPIWNEEASGSKSLETLSIVFLLSHLLSGFEFR